MNLKPAVKHALNILPLGLLALIAWLFARNASAPTPEAATETKAVPAKAAPPVPAVPQVNLDRYTPFDFSEVFKLPAGPKGFEYTDKINSLAGGPVRMEGFMVRHLHDDHEVFLFATFPVLLNQKEYGLADDLPANAVHVRMETPKGQAPAWTKEKLLVCGQLDIGPRQEQDGRISHVRLRADMILRASDRTPVDLLRPIVLQPERVNSSLSASAAQ
ncbi:MAG: hypothetical protein EOP86_01095 [Verrucomicrobiaceae bacterium]|nr:MAG: hypothetical protein EOP86_01095 [Verrucomicrobiaceae bacterium]